MRHWLLFLSVTCVQAQTQTPKYQPGWPCTGKERSFDPVYSQIAEASGGHLFLNDPSEMLALSKLAIGGMNHNATITRATSRLESFVEVGFPVDVAIESLFVVASVQCLQIAELYDPDGRAVRPQLIPGGEEDRYRAGWIVTIPQPVPGRWTLRIAGQGYYSYAVEAKTRLGIHATFDPSSRRVNAENISNLSLIGGGGEDLGSLDPDGRIPPNVSAFRVRMIGIDANGNARQRVDPRLYQAP
jgi:hypothetical protein